MRGIPAWVCAPSQGSLPPAPGKDLLLLPLAMRGGAMGRLPGVSGLERDRGRNHNHVFLICRGRAQKRQGQGGRPGRGKKAGAGEVWPERALAWHGRRDDVAGSCSS